MAERPVYIPSPESLQLVEERFFTIRWSPGFALSQKKKNIVALHEAARAGGLDPLLEVSSKSSRDEGFGAQSLFAGR